MGAEFKDEIKPPEKVEPEETPTMFGDPESYKHLTKDQRKEMTKRMKSNILTMLTSKTSMAKEKK